VQQHLGRLEGVAKVEVSLLQGSVTILPKVDAKLDPGRILKATYDSGVTVAEMSLTASGWIEKSAAGELVLRINGDQSFPVAPGTLATELEPLAGTGRTVTVRARLYKKPAGKEAARPADRLRLEILEVLKKG
jgi:hypothetical protein